MEECSYPAAATRKEFPLLTLRSLLLTLVLCPFLLALTPESSPAQEARQSAVSPRDSAQVFAEYRNPERQKHDFFDDSDNDSDRERHRRNRRPRAKLRIKNLTRDHEGLNWIRLDARRSRDKDGTIQGYVFRILSKPGIQAGFRHNVRAWALC